jgi:hypothetical protein
MRGGRSIILAGLAALALAACGSSSPTTSPLGSDLSYFPQDSPFLLSLVTSPNAPAVKNGQTMLGRIPFATFGQAELISRLEQRGIDYDSDIRPLFGNPLMLGVAGSGSRATAIAAWVTKDAGALSSLIKKLHPTPMGSHMGASLYRLSSTTIAVDGATVIAGGSSATVDAAIDRHAAGSGMKPAEYYGELGSLPRNGLLEIAGDLAPVLSASGRTSKALGIPWVSALRGYGVAVTAGPAGLSLRYSLNTTGKPLTPSELPIAPGSSPPGLAGSMPIQLGLRQPAAAIAFALEAERQASPARYAADMAEVNAVRRRTGVDFQRDVLGQIGNSAALESNGHGFILRVDVNDPAAAARTLRRLGTSALDVFGSHPGARISAGPAGLEAVRSGHSPVVLFGLLGGEFVAGTGTPAELRAFAAAPAAAAPGAQGAIAFRVALPQLIELATHGSLSSTIQEVLNTLGDVTGWLSSTPGALTGSATLALK